MKELKKEVDLYLLILQMNGGNDEFQFLMKQNQIFLHHYFKELSINDMTFLKEFTSESIKTKDYLRKNQLTENQYYAKQRKILRKMRSKKDGTYKI